ncbi:MAG: xanthine dehydrogenase accessory protein XdhC [Burkholderiaceae bacterium]
MSETWQAAARRLLPGRRLLRATVANTRGSTPRESGATLLIAADVAWGTIGGGRLEWEVLCEARRLLAHGADLAITEREFVLGPDLNQCCGGRVTIALAPVSETDLACPPGKPALALQLHGAGHVAQALVTVLRELPGFDLQWIDARAELPIWRDGLPPYRHCADPVGAVAEAPAGALVLVMTHDHALDYEICRAVLQRDDAIWLGLIASASKAARFRSRFAREGLAPQAARLLQAPVGLPGITGKVPSVIAVGIAAQLLLLATDDASARLPACATSCGACAGCDAAEVTS